jgi:uncharacterized membrane protein
VTDAPGDRPSPAPAPDPDAPADAPVATADEAAPADAPADAGAGAVEAPEERPAHEIVVLSLDKVTRAGEVLLALTNLANEGKLAVHDAVIVAKDERGHSRVVQTVDVTPLRGALAGSWWGMLGGLLVGGPVFLAAAIGGAAAGALYGRLVDKGLDDGWVREMADWVEPGRSALLLLVDAAYDHAVVTELQRFEGVGRVAYTTLPPDARLELERALDAD